LSTLAPVDPAATARRGQTHARRRIYSEL